jgi:hypothetical protein
MIFLNKVAFYTGGASFHISRYINVQKNKYCRNINLR